VTIVFTPRGQTQQISLSDNGDGTWSGTIPCAADGQLELVVRSRGGQLRVPIGRVAMKPAVRAEKPCLQRPVHAWVRGKAVKRVVFYLNGRRIRTVSRTDGAGRYGVRVRRTGLGKGRHRIHAKVFFVRAAQKRPVMLRLATITRCLKAQVPQAIRTTPNPGCGREPFRAWVAGDKIRRVTYKLDGRRLDVVDVATWNGRYAVLIDPTGLKPGRHRVTAHIDFVASTKLPARTLRVAFRKCR
jgi:hypothetical protein